VNRNFRLAGIAGVICNTYVIQGSDRLIDILENRSETSYVRGRAAEALSHAGNPAWAVFALGGMAQFRPALHSVAIAALRGMVDDAGDMPGYWSVGREARAMLESLIPRQERDTILADVNAPAELRRWAECYSRKSAPDDRVRRFIEARYKTLCWLRCPKRTTPEVIAENPD
jgi:hypothetical protein